MKPLINSLISIAPCSFLPETNKHIVLINLPRNNNSLTILSSTNNKHNTKNSHSLVNMRFSTSVVAASAVASGAFAKTIPIEVGSMGLAYSPNSTEAAVGDVLEFSFYPRNHNVVQGSFNSPCAVGAIASPVYSGFVPVTAGKSVCHFSIL